jgi:hypothetical protein
LFPVLLFFSLTNRSVNEPADSPGLKFPRRALFFSLSGAFFSNPTGFQALLPPPSPENKEKHLSLHMGRDRSPPLFIAVYSFNGCAEQLPHLLLGLLEACSKISKLFAIHESP